MTCTHWCDVIKGAIDSKFDICALKRKDERWLATELDKDRGRALETVVEREFSRSLDRRQTRTRLSDIEREAQLTSNRDRVCSVLHLEGTTHA